MPHQSFIPKKASTWEALPFGEKLEVDTRIKQYIEGPRYRLICEKNNHFTCLPRGFPRCLACPMAKLRHVLNGIRSQVFYGEKFLRAILMLSRRKSVHALRSFEFLPHYGSCSNIKQFLSKTLESKIWCKMQQQTKEIFILNLQWKQ